MRCERGRGCQLITKVNLDKVLKKLGVHFKKGLRKEKKERKSAVE
jgi:hypothetical protein